MSREPRPDGKIVELANFGSRFEAETVMSLLADNDIRATAKFGDADGWAPHFALVDGYRVLVFDDELEAARAILEQDEELNAAPESEPNPS